MPLTKSQVRAAFTAARKHFGGKIPKGTKLARFVPGHHKTTRSSSSSGGSRRPSRLRRSVSMGKKKSGGHHMSEVTKAKNGALLALAFVPRIQDTKDILENKIDGQTYVNRVVADYTGYSMNDGNFVASRLLRGWGPIVGAGVLGKAISIMRKRFKV